MDSFVLSILQKNLSEGQINQVMNLVVSSGDCKQHSPATVELLIQFLKQVMIYEVPHLYHDQMELKLQTRKLEETLATYIEKKEKSMVELKRQLESTARSDPQSAKSPLSESVGLFSPHRENRDSMVSTSSVGGSYHPGGEKWWKEREAQITQLQKQSPPKRQTYIDPNKRAEFVNTANLDRKKVVRANSHAKCCAKPTREEGKSPLKYKHLRKQTKENQPCPDLSSIRPSQPTTEGNSLVSIGTNLMQRLGKPSPLHSGLSSHRSFKS